MMKKIERGERVFIHKRAYLAGEVSLGDDANIWCGACIRGDIAPVRIGKGTNVQDNVTVHVGYGLPAVIGDYTTIGHNAVIHGCTIGNNCLIGMGAIILDGAVIGDDCIIGAGTLIPFGKKIPSGSVAFGNPFRIVRPVSENDKENVRKNAEAYIRLADEYKAAGEGE